AKTLDAAGDFALHATLPEVSMQFQQDQNPYAAPTYQPDPVAAPPDDEMQLLADRGSRWFARFIDALFGLLAAVPGIAVLFATDIMTTRDLRNSGLVALAYWGCALPFAAYQWSLLTRTGQSLGKKWMKLRIVKVDGSPVGFGSAVVLREWITAGLGL